MDYYPWLKAFHIAAVLIWISGMLSAALAISALWPSKPSTESPCRTVILDAVRRWDRRATAPAMSLAWVLGIVLAMQGGWFGAPWLSIKLALVVLLSAIHGILSGTLRRLERADGARLPFAASRAPLVIIVAAIGIIVLVAVKPF